MTTNTTRLYSNFVGTLKGIQKVLYLIVGLGSLGFGTSIDESIIGLIFGGFIGAIGLFFTYLSTEGLIALIDLGSRIEQNTRIIAKVYNKQNGVSKDYKWD